MWSYDSRTVVVQRNASDEVTQAISGWLAKHGIGITPAGIGMGMSIRRDVENRRIGILCECGGMPCGDPVEWYQLEAGPLPWPDAVLDLVGTMEG